jgi:hypothetical protein
MIADADGKNPKQVLSGLHWARGFTISPDEKSVVCGAQQGKEWNLIRVSFDGSPPVKLCQTSGVACPLFRFLDEGRIVCAVRTGYHIEKHQFGTRTVGKGPVILIDGKKETVLIKETARFPEVSPDATRMALDGENEKGETVVEITDLKTRKKEEIPLKAFNKDWTCEFDRLKFGPDGKALLVTFSLGGVVFRRNGPLPGDEAVEHFGVIWLDGRKDRTAMFRIDQPREKNGHFAHLDHIEWSSMPPEKK